jgi:hypothetical protein
MIYLNDSRLGQIFQRKMNSSSDAIAIARKREVNATRKIFIIVVFCILCWLPMQILNMIGTITGSHVRSEFINKSAKVLQQLSSAVDPILYAYHLKGFRRAIFVLLRLKIIVKRNQNTLSGTA